MCALMKDSANLGLKRKLFSSRNNYDDVGYTPPIPTGENFPTTCEGLFYHYTKLYNLYCLSQQQLTIALAANTNYSSTKENEDEGESLF